MKTRLNHLVGGNAGNGGNAGLLYLNCNNDLGNANWNYSAREYEISAFLWWFNAAVSKQLRRVAACVRVCVKSLTFVSSLVKAGGAALRSCAGVSK